jgi:hypothetical protein
MSNLYLDTTIPQTEDGTLRAIQRLSQRLNGVPTLSEITLLASAARTTATNSSIIDNADGYPGVILWLKVTAVPGAGGITPRLLAYSSDSWAQDLALFNSSLGTVQEAFWIIYPGAGLISRSSGLFTSVNYNVRLPLRWRFNMLVESADSYTYEVKYRYLP